MIGNEKLPPQNLEAEMSVLGAALFDPEAIFKLVEILRPNYFYSDIHKAIYEVMLSLFDKGTPVDIITVKDKLHETGKLGDIGGEEYLANLAESVSTSAHVVDHARIVKEKYYLRSLIAIATKIVESSYDQSREAKEVLDEAEQLIFQISTENVDGSVSSMKELVKDTLASIEALSQRKELVTGIPSGFHKLDELTAGLHNSDLIILAARPSMGKSAFALNICEYAAIEEKVPVAFFSLEMSKEQLAQRLLCSVARINAQNVRTGFISKEDGMRMVRVSPKLAEAPIFIDDTPGISVMELRGKVRRLKSRHNIGLVIVDYLQLMQVGMAGRRERHQEIAEISRRLKAIAREVNIPVIALSQLSREVEKRPDKRPQLSDLRESGSIEQDADLVLFLYREEYYNPNEENKGKAEVIIAKQRNGPSGRSVYLTFMKEYTRFENLSMREPENVYN